MKLIKGQEFKSFKALCIHMGWVDKSKTISTGMKKRLEKDLTQIADWNKVEGSNKIIINEIYSEKKKRIDGRCKNNKYIDLIEKILRYELNNIDGHVYYSTSIIAKKLGLYNEDIYNYDMNYDILEEDLNIERKLISLFVFKSRFEINRIIERAVDSMIKSGTLDGDKGIVLVSKGKKSRLADEKEERIIKDIEKRVLTDMKCKNKYVLLLKGRLFEFKERVLEAFLDGELKNVVFYYNGYYINGFNYENNIIDVEKEKDFLRDIICKRLTYVGETINIKAIEKEYHDLVFGEPMLMDFKCSEYFMYYWNIAIEHFELS